MECATFQIGGAGMGNLYLEIVSAMFLHWFLKRLNVIALVFRRYKLYNWILTLKSTALLPSRYFKPKWWIILLQNTSQMKCFLNFLIEQNIVRASIPLDNGFNVDYHRDMRFFSTFSTPHILRVSCTLSWLCLGVYNSQMGGVNCISCFGRCCSFLSSGGVFSSPLVVVGACQWNEVEQPL